ncbi:hypothetical protein FI667_g7973, partial [Globisporangium splendens]
MEQRIKLVFADEIARFVERRRGFCACWYLVPRGAKLVGDLAYAIMAEFELLGACPSGIELVLQELPLLPNQDVRIVRDNDEIHVHCVSSGIVTPYSSSSSVSSARSVPLSSGYKQRDVAMLFGSPMDESEEDVELDKHDQKRRKRQLRQLQEMQQQAREAAIEEKKRRKESKKKEKEEKQQKSQRQKAKAAEKLAAKANKESSSSSSSSGIGNGEDDGNERKEHAKKPRKILATSKRKANGDKERSSKSDSSSSSDDSSSSNSSSSDSESEDEKPTEPERKRLRTSQPPAPALPTRPTVNSKSVASLNKPHAAAAETEQKQRRRRRPRHRKPREASTTTANNGKEAIVIRKSTLPPTSNANSVDSQRSCVLTPPAASVAPPQSHSVAVSNVGDSSAATTTPIVKSHVRFDDAGESQLVAPAEKALNVRKPRSAYIPQELHKYGPRPEAAAATTERSRRRQSHDKRNPQAANGNPAAGSSKKKAKADEMWKRPYEIVASIHDTPTQDPVPAPSIDIPSLLAKFPQPPSTIAISTESVAVSDVIAYKTLTLCMETWQPLLSAWLCGHVTSVARSEGTICVKSMALSINDQQLQWKEKETQLENSEEDTVVQVSELSELRYLDGPSSQVMNELQNQQQP